MLAGDGTVVAAGPGVAPVPDGFTGVLVPTSGSTGTPKIVMLSRSALIRAATLVEKRLGGAGQWVNPLPLQYVAGLMTLVRALVAGQLHTQVGPQLQGLTAPGTRAYISLVPAQLHAGLADPATSATLAGFEAVLVGGAGLDPGLRRRAEEAGLRVVTTYGMSETCGGVVYDGRPLDTVGVELVDPGDGVGRIALVTPTAFDGYLGDPVRTAEVLSDRRVLTYDRGRFDDGRLTVLGRVDEVVQSGGANVDLAWVQRLLDDAFPQKVACFSVPDPVWGATIVVASAEPRLDEILARVGPSLDSPARPRGFLPVATLPRTSSGKIDRTALARMWTEHGKRA